jgi:spermidine synthase
MTLDDSWFTEIYDEQGAAFSLSTTSRLHEERSTYQHIEVFETRGFGRLLTLDGMVMLTGRDNFIYHEMMTHPALFSHAAPKKVLIIGGGDCGCLLEVLKHPGVERADLADIDERVTRVCEQYFPELCASNDDPRAFLNFADGIKWVEDAPGGAYDVIIIDSTDPVGQAARLFAQEFYAACFHALGADGILVVQSESPLFHGELIHAIAGRMRGAGFASTESLYYPQCSYPSGWWSATMARRDGRRHWFRESDAGAKRFATRYYNAGIHRAALTEPEFMAQGAGRPDAPR